MQAEESGKCGRFIPPFPTWMEVSRGTCEGDGAARERLEAFADDTPVLLP